MLILHRLILKNVNFEILYNGPFSIYKKPQNISPILIKIVILAQFHHVKLLEQKPKQVVFMNSDRGGFIET